jgi:hypothetical protein
MSLGELLEQIRLTDVSRLRDVVAASRGRSCIRSSSSTQPDQESLGQTLNVAMAG